MLTCWWDCESDAGAAQKATCLSVSGVTTDENFKTISEFTFRSRLRRSRAFEVDAMLAHNIPLEKIKNEPDSNGQLINKLEKKFKELKNQGATFVGFNSYNYDNLLLSVQSSQSIWKLISSKSKGLLHAEIMNVLERFKLADRADTLAGELSHGLQQWLEIAMAVIRKPKLLLLDEPTGGMSPEERRATGELLLPIKKTCTLIIVEHDLDFIKDICDNLTVLDQGKIIDTGTVEEIKLSKKVQEVYTTRV